VSERKARGRVELLLSSRLHPGRRAGPGGV